MSKLILTLSLFLAIGFAAQAQNNNLIQNGSFKQGLSNWKMSTDNQKVLSMQVSSDYAAFGLTDNYVGMNFVHLNSQVAIEQTVATTVGESYVFGFGYSHLPNVGDKQIIVNIDGKPTYTYTIKQNEKQGRFQHKHFAFKAQGANTNIRIYVVSISGKEEKGILLSDVICDVESEVDLKLFYAY
jgi:hypothetical protein